MSRAEDPLSRIDPETKHRIRVASTVYATARGQFPQRAVAEYVERHAEPLEARVPKADVALKAGDTALAGYLIGKE
jgi:hypothetical protein